MKKFLLVLSIFVMLFTLSAFTLADTTVDAEVLSVVQADVDETNAAIDEMIDEAVNASKDIIKQYDANVKLAQRELSGQALEDRINSLYANKETQINNLINNLINETNAEAQAMFDRAEKLGVEVVCELVPVEIDGRIVMIDPIRVVGD